MIYETEMETGQAIGDEMSHPSDGTRIRDWQLPQPELQLGLQEIEFSAPPRRYTPY